MPPAGSRALDGSRAVVVGPARLEPCGESGHVVGGGRRGRGQPVRAGASTFPAALQPRSAAKGTDQIRAEIHPKDLAADLGCS